MHIYVFWRVTTVPFVTRHVPLKILIGAGLILWAIFFLGRVIGHGGTGVPAGILEFLGMNWMAALFLIFISLLAIDIITLFIDKDADAVIMTTPLGYTPGKGMVITPAVHKQTERKMNSCPLSITAGNVSILA